MANFLVYTKTVCPYCTSAKAWLRTNGHTYEERNAEVNEAFMKELKTKVPNVRTVPQIFLGDYHIGGYDDLLEASRTGTLKMLLDSQ